MPQDVSDTYIHARACVCVCACAREFILTICFDCCFLDNGLSAPVWINIA